MQAFVTVTALSLAIYYFSLRPKLKSDKKVFWVGLAFLIPGYVLTALASFHVLPPNLYLPFDFIVKSLTGQWNW